MTSKENKIFVFFLKDKYGTVAFEDAYTAEKETAEKALQYLVERYNENYEDQTYVQYEPVAEYKVKKSINVSKVMKKEPKNGK